MSKGSRAGLRMVTGSTGMAGQWHMGRGGLSLGWDISLHFMVRTRNGMRRFRSTCHVAQVMPRTRAAE